MALLLDPILFHSSVFSPMSLSQCCNYIPWYIPKRTENICLHKNLYQNIHSSIIPVKKNKNNLNVHQLRMNIQNVKHINIMKHPVIKRNEY